MGNMLMVISKKGEAIADIMEPYSVNHLTSFEGDANPNAKWEWYHEGGMWRAFISLKEGHYADSAPIKDINFVDDARYYYVLDWWYSNFDKFDTNEETRKFKEMSAGDFARMKSRLYSREVLVDGEWISFDDEEVSEKDWSEGFYKRFIEGRDETDIITIVDYGML